jgi:hypothetical protein
MAVTSLHLVGTASGVSLFAPEDSYLSFFNSPYVGHRRCSAVDIYPSHEEWYGPVFSPCDGVIQKIRKFKMGQKKSFPTEDYDYAIGIAPEGHEGLLVRVLHCMPDIEIGDSVEKGENLGKTIRSRYFNYWTGPHYHVEVMLPDHFSRPSQSYPIEIRQERVQLHEVDFSEQIECEISKIKRNLLICESRNLSFVSIGQRYGHLASIDEVFGILDAGIPHYEQGGILTDRVLGIESKVEALGTQLGRVVSSDETVALFAVGKGIRVNLDGERIGGVSTHFYSKSQLIGNRPPIFLIPKKSNQFHGWFSEGDRFTLSVES